MEEEKRETLEKLLKEAFEYSKNSECEVTIKNIPNRGLEVHLDGNNGTIFIGLISVLKNVVADMNGDFDMVRMFWDITGTEREIIDNE